MPTWKGKERLVYPRDDDDDVGVDNRARGYDTSRTRPFQLGKYRQSSLLGYAGPSTKRSVHRRDDVEGDGGTDGVVLPLDMVGSGIYDVAYTLPVKFGDSQQFSLQVDTGSSDLWVASKSCSTSSCGLTNGRLYDPTNARETGQDFSIPYLQGSASGPIVWDKVSLGGYTIDNQALAAASDVESEPLAPNFSGILGLALPLNSIIAQDIPPVTSNAPDGAAFASNLFSITPTSSAPASRFISLSLSRPGSSTIPSLLGIGRHPSSLVPDPSKVEYDSVVSESTGTLFWKASVRAITVYVAGQAKPVALGRSASGMPWPSAVLDSGVPLILTTSAVANAVYGAIGVKPADDGTYYVPCTTPLNLTVTLDSRAEIPLHPLDLTAEPADDNKAQFCIGLIQPADGVLGTGGGGIGDMILGVPFLRNVYMVMGYTTPNDNGTFPVVGSTITTSTNDDDDSTTTPTRVSTKVTPVLGLLPLTTPSIALAEFNTVRVLNQPLSSSTPTAPNTGADANTKTVSVGGKKLSVGIVVLIALGAFAGVCCVLFLGRWLLLRRSYRKRTGGKNWGGSDERVDLDAKTAYRLARRSSLGALGAVPLVGLGVGAGLAAADGSTRAKRSIRKTGKGLSESTVGSDRTLAVHPDEEGEFGYKKTRDSRSDDDEDEDHDEDDEWDHRLGRLTWGNEAEDTLVGGARKSGTNKLPADVPHSPITPAEERPLVSALGDGSPPSSPDQATFPHARTYSDPQNEADSTPRGLGHANTPSIQIPLLAAAAVSGPSSNPLQTNSPPSPPSRQRTQSTLLSTNETEEAIVANHARLFSIDATGPDTRVLQPTAVGELRAPTQPPARQDSNVLDLSELGVAPARPRPPALHHSNENEDRDEDGENQPRLSMAGIGSGRRLLGFGRSSIDSLPFNRESLMSVSSVGTVIAPVPFGTGFGPALWNGGADERRTES